MRVGRGRGAPGHQPGAPAALNPTLACEGLPIPKVGVCGTSPRTSGDGGNTFSSIIFVSFSFLLLPLRVALPLGVCRSDSTSGPPSVRTSGLPRGHVPGAQLRKLTVPHLPVDLAVMRFMLASGWCQTITAFFARLRTRRTNALRLSAVGDCELGAVNSSPWSDNGRTVTHPSAFYL